MCRTGRVVRVAVDARRSRCDWHSQAESGNEGCTKPAVRSPRRVIDRVFDCRIVRRGGLIGFASKYDDLELSPCVLFQVRPQPGHIASPFDLQTIAVPESLVERFDHFIRPR